MCQWAPRLHSGPAHGIVRARSYRVRAHHYLHRHVSLLSSVQRRNHALRAALGLPLLAPASATAAGQHAWGGVQQPPRRRVLGVHMRGSDKRHGSVVPAERYACCQDAAPAAPRARRVVPRVLQPGAVDGGRRLGGGARARRLVEHVDRRALRRAARRVEVRRVRPVRQAGATFPRCAHVGQIICQRRHSNGVPQEEALRRGVDQKRLVAALKAV